MTAAQTVWASFGAGLLLGAVVRLFVVAVRRRA